MRHRLLCLAAVLAACSLPGCSAIGPSSIRNGRSTYNDAITSTGNEQLLSLIVRHRYAENAQLLAVSSVTANMRVSARVGSEVGFGPDSNFSGNLVPLSTSVVVEENPTISYTPLDGEQFIRELLTAVPFDIAMLLITSDHEPIDIFALLVERIEVAQLLEDGNEVPGQSIGAVEFTRLLRQIDSDGTVAWDYEPGRGASVTLRWSQASDGEMQAFASRLGLGFPPSRSVQFGLSADDGAIEPGSLTLRTRSLGDLVRLGGAAMEVPVVHIESGLARTVPTEAAIASRIQIRSGRSRSSDAYVASRLHNTWYWIDSKDLQTKKFFKLLTTLVSVRLSDSVRGNTQAPVLTIPTTR